MANISDVIEQFILKSLKEDGTVEISRNDLAGFFSCVPSQINYVLETRFTLDRGFVKESRRGGGGFIRISKVPVSDDTYVNSLIMESIGDELTERRASQILDKLQDDEVIEPRERMLIQASISERALNMPYSFKDKLRAQIFKNVLVVLLKEKEGDK